MRTLAQVGMILLGGAYLIFEVVLRVFTFVCAVFATYVMVALMIEWTTKLFQKRRPVAQVRAA